MVANKPANAGLLISVHSLWVTNLNPRPKKFPKISGSDLKYSQILQTDCGDWFDFDCVGGVAVASILNPTRDEDFYSIREFAFDPFLTMLIRPGLSGIAGDF
jgi:hypothetical protein